MDLNHALEILDTVQQKLYAYGFASSALQLDGDTVAPRDTAEGRGVALGVLAGEEQRILTDPQLAEALQCLQEGKQQLDQRRNRQVEELARSVKQQSRIPEEEFMRYAALVNEATSVWKQAKEQSSFPLFQPYLEELVQVNRRFAGYYDPDKKPYDALLNEYERGVDEEYLDSFFAVLRERLVPLIQEVGEKPQPDVRFLHLYYPVYKQKQLSEYLMGVLDLDRAHCGIGETEHPFTLNFNSQDVRITTHYYENDLTSSMFSVLHEGGHARYELDVDPSLDYTVLAGGVSTGVHESQSRFYENIIGRSLPFIGSIYPKVQSIFPEQLSSVSAEQFWKAVNRAEPSLIRIEADELTYSLHIMVRYEIEKELIGGTLAVQDVPEAWNQLYKQVLGVEVPDDRHGCLQDSHWAGGLIGYFPSYALGSAYGAQMLRNMEKEMDVWGPVGRGDLSFVTQWLKEKVHQYGSLLKPAQVVENACGKFDATAYTDYLTEKYTSLYDL